VQLGYQATGQALDLPALANPKTLQSFFHILSFLIDQKASP
jgi:hypothetical protein